MINCNDLQAWAGETRTCLCDAEAETKTMGINLTIEQNNTRDRLAAGQGASIAAEAYAVNRSTIDRWKPTNSAIAHAFQNAREETADLRRATGLSHIEHSLDAMFNPTVIARMCLKSGFYSPPGGTDQACLKLRPFRTGVLHSSLFIVSSPPTKANL